MNINYIRIKINEPEGFSKLRIKTLGNGIKAIIGFVKGGSDIQSYIFPKNQYSVNEAKIWVKEHVHQIQEVYLVNDVMINPTSFGLTFVEEVYHEDIKKSKHDWMFEKRTNEDIFYGDET
jgi:hypothetical protein